MRRFIVLGLLLMTPFLMGAYFKSCTRTTIGFWPNHPWIPEVEPNGKNLEKIALLAANQANIHGTTLFVPWTNDYHAPTYEGLFYKFGSGDCASRRNDTIIRAYARDFLETWVSSEGAELNLEVVFPIHVPLLATGWGIGPECARGLGGGFLANPALRDEFAAFMFTVLDILEEEQFDGLQWAVSVGNEVDLYLSGAGLIPPLCLGALACGTWDEFRDFLVDMRNRIHERYGVLPRVGTSMTWHALLRTPRPGQNFYRWNTDKVFTALDLVVKSSDVIFFTYYPNREFDHPTAPFQILPPDDVHIHLLAMAIFAQSVQSERRRLTPVYIQEVGYSTSSVVGSNQAMQRTFVIEFFEALHDSRRYIRGASWWSLYDWGPTSCPFWAPVLQPILCFTGLLNEEGLPKDAWFEFVDGALDAETWNPFF